MSDTEASKTRTSLRKPAFEDAAALWQLVRDSGVLDLNSSYLYLLLCRDFAETCVVAERQGRVIGFITAYRPPRRPDVLFVWQVCVCQSARRQGLALQMLHELVDRVGDQSPLHFLEATVAPSNQPSLRMFESLAKRLGVSMTQQAEFTSSHFPGGDHEPEPLIRIGPLPGNRRDSSPSRQQQSNKSPALEAGNEEAIL